MRHIVVFKYKEGATQEQIQTITDAFSQLPEKIPGIVDFEHGENNSPEGLNKGFNHVYVVTFDSEKSRDEYLPHPEHKKFGELLGDMDILEDAFVIDYSLDK
ncbi:Dabb family protein [Gilvimarinus xylanilyticus]|uniref:Dabb family protein n=1 Tax=Gilvimarinus xylanilyticus TaxID=2944139 RepID=A0A9X2I611_9GAMM|nr:Dabb family protein [Gilvimarinus xylanilyticus]